MSVGRQQSTFIKVLFGNVFAYYDLLNFNVLMIALEATYAPK